MPENPHLVYLEVGIDYDWLSLDLIGMDDKGLLSGFNSDVSDGHISLNWKAKTAIANNTKTGTIISLTFRILKAPQEGYTPVSIRGVYSYDKDFKNNGFSITSGKVAIACNTHKFGNYSTNSEKHWRTCSYCSYQETGAHEFDHTCEGTCSVCSGYVRAESHDIVMNRDKFGHWYACSICKNCDPKSFHVPGPEATEQSAQVCTVCGYIIQPALQHNHEFSPNLSSNEQGHWHACSGCEERKSYAEHKFENACSTKCTDCEYTREITHSYSAQWSKDQNTHWHACIICNAKHEEAAHEPGSEATKTSAQTCSVCGQELAPAIPTPTTPATAPTTSPTTPAPTFGETKPSGENDTPLWIVAIIVAVITSCAVCSCVVMIIMKKKK